MQSLFIEYVFLILIILALVAVANKLGVAYPIILVIGGLALSFTSLFTKITIQPDAIFFIFLPPLLYEASWQVSWKELWRWRRVVTSFAFPIVIITSCVVAFASNAIIPGFTLALGFLLGGIVSPPDAVSASTIMRDVKAPRSLVSIIEGECLLNDASSLIVFRFALAAILTGEFYFGRAAGTFALVITMGILIGVLVGVIFYVIHRYFIRTSNIEVVLTLVTPYCMYYAAEHFHSSGVLSVVAGGLFLSSRRQSMLTYRSRIEGINVWSNLVFVMNGLVFLLIGLQLPSITKQLENENIGIWTAIGYGLAISLVLIVTRLLCTLGASVITTFMSRFIKVEDANPGWKAPLITGWAGMRGVVSLAAALSIPVLTYNYQPFPYRNLILFITFIVILVTLVLQGLTLPFLIRKLKLEDKYNTIPIERQEQIIQRKIAKASFKHLAEKYGDERMRNMHLDNLLKRLKIDLEFFQQDNKVLNDSDENTFSEYKRIYLEMLQVQRDILIAMNKRTEFDEELIRRYLSFTDIEEYKIRDTLFTEVDDEQY